MSYLKSKGISTGVHLMPLTLHPIYKKYNKGLENTTKVWSNLFSLPLFPDMKKNQVVKSKLECFFSRRNKGNQILYYN